MRIYELAHELNVTTRDLMGLLESEFDAEDLSPDDEVEEELQAWVKVYYSEYDWENVSPPPRDKMTIIPAFDLAHELDIKIGEIIEILESEFGFFSVGLDEAIPGPIAEDIRDRYGEQEPEEVSETAEAEPEEPAEEQVDAETPAEETAQVYELAYELGITNEELLSTLQNEFDEDVRGLEDELEPEVVSRVRSHFGGAPAASEGETEEQQETGQPEADSAEPVDEEDVEVPEDLGIPFEEALDGEDEPVEELRDVDEEASDEAVSESAGSADDHEPDAVESQEDVEDRPATDETAEPELEEAEMTAEEEEEDVEPEETEEPVSEAEAAEEELEEDEVPETEEEPELEEAKTGAEEQDEQPDDTEEPVSEAEAAEEESEAPAEAAGGSEDEDVEEGTPIYELAFKLEVTNQELVQTLESEFDVEVEGLEEEVSSGVVSALLAYYRDQKAEEKREARAEEAEAEEEAVEEPEAASDEETEADEKEEEREEAPVAAESDETSEEDVDTEPEPEPAETASSADEQSGEEPEAEQTVSEEVVEEIEVPISAFELAQTLDASLLDLIDVLEEEFDTVISDPDDEVPEPMVEKLRVYYTGESVGMPDSYEESNTAEDENGENETEEEGSSDGSSESTEDLTDPETSENGHEETEASPESLVEEELEHDEAGSNGEVKDAEEIEGTEISDAEGSAPEGSDEDSGTESSAEDRGGDEANNPTDSNGQVESATAEATTSPADVPDEYRLSILKKIGPDALNTLLEYSNHLTLAEGEVLFEQGDQPDDTFYVVISGEIDVDKELRTKTETVSTLKPGDTFGEYGMFTGHLRSAAPRANQPSEVLEITREALRQLKGQHPVEHVLLCEEIMEDMSRRIERYATKAQEQSNNLFS